VDLFEKPGVETVGLSASLIGREIAKDGGATS